MMPDDEPAPRNKWMPARSKESMMGAIMNMSPE
jgi:hypothetical protein